MQRAGGLTILALLLLFALHGTAWQWPPAVNEPHWLCKARHWWQPDYCPRDFFLQSFNAHAVFLWVAGAALQFASLEQVAWGGRLLVWGLLAWSWRRALIPVLQSEFAVLFAAGLLLIWMRFCTLSGEWLLGGVEAKGFAWALVLLAVGELSRGRFQWGGAAAGAAIALHPLVGGWAVIAVLIGISLACLSERFQRLCCRTSPPRSNDTVAPLSDDAVAPQGENAAARQSVDAASRSPGLKTLLATGGWLILCSLPGLIPALRLLMTPTTPEQSTAAAIEQVYGRLRHHLDPRSFDGVSVGAYLLLACLWCGGRYFVDRRSSRLARSEPLSTPDNGCGGDPSWVGRALVSGSMVIAAVGLIVGYSEPLLTAVGLDARSVMAKLLKFYPFRLVDLVLPAGVACLISAALLPKPTSNSIDSDQRIADWLGRMVKILITAFSVAVATLVAAWPPPGVSTGGRLTPQLWADWERACAWAKQNSDADSLWVTPTFSRGFKWYAERSEFVCHKDCPQDTAGILEWRRRMNLWERWRKDSFPAGVTVPEMKLLVRETQAEYLLLHAEIAVQEQPIYRNETFAIYRLPGE